MVSQSIHATTTGGTEPSIRLSGAQYIRLSLPYLLDEANPWMTYNFWMLQKSGYSEIFYGLLWHLIPYLVRRILSCTEEIWTAYNYYVWLRIKISQLSTL